MVHVRIVAREVSVANVAWVIVGALHVLRFKSGMEGACSETHGFLREAGVDVLLWPSSVMALAAKLSTMLAVALVLSSNGYVVPVGGPQPIQSSGRACS